MSFLYVHVTSVWSVNARARNIRFGRVSVAVPQKARRPITAYDSQPGARFTE
jgi:hypothetical protein